MDKLGQKIVVEQLLDGWTRELRAQRLQELALEHAGSNFEHLDSGEPYLVGDEGRDISISHTRDFIALMVSSEGRCGVDIELLSRDITKLTRRFASENELSITQREFSDNAPLLIWCAKEAVYKYLGREGVDFLRDMVVVEAHPQRLMVDAMGEIVELKWQVENYGEDRLLIVSKI